MKDAKGHGSNSRGLHSAGVTRIPKVMAKAMTAGGLTPAQQDRAMRRFGKGKAKAAEATMQDSKFAYRREMMALAPGLSSLYHPSGRERWKYSS